MSTERVFQLDQETLELFAKKGKQNGCGPPQKANKNGLRVRRVMQLIRDSSRKPFDQLRILDLACGEGVFAIEAALRGAEVTALDARTDRMSEGVKAAQRLGLKNLRFEQADVRSVNTSSHGWADVILFLGILYHLDHQDAFQVLQDIYELCYEFVIIDTHVALESHVQVEHDGHIYEGKHVREHADEDSEVVRKSRFLASFDNPLSFWFTKESLLRLLNDIGFTSVCECNVPLNPFESLDRITLIAAKGESVNVSSYPWMNDRSEEEIELLLTDDLGQVSDSTNGATTPGLMQLAKSIVNGVLRTFDLKIIRLP